MVNTATYQPDDLVTFSGQTFRAKRTVPANRQPAANAFWELFAQKGDPGPNTGIAAGNASTPSISFTSDPDTGIFSPGAGKVALVENGALFLHNIGTGNTALGAGALIANTEANNTAVGTMALNANTTGHDNTAVGSNALINNSTGLGNTALGALALFANTTGAANTAVGSTALSGMITGASNTAVGSGALLVNNGSNNTAVGASTLAFNNSGTDNIAIGRAAGFSATTSDNGIFIGSLGVSGDTATIRIGTQATQTRAFMAGIRGITTMANDAVAVLVSSTGQLGTVSSSRRYKTDIETHGRCDRQCWASCGRSRSATSRRRTTAQHPLQYGLIAEEVAETFPDLAVFNTDGQRGDGEVPPAAIVSAGRLSGAAEHDRGAGTEDRNADDRHCRPERAAAPARSTAAAEQGGGAAIV